MGNFPYEPSRYPFYITDTAMERGKGLGGGYDFFVNQDKRNGVTYDENDFAHYAKGLRTQGKRTMSSSIDSDKKGGHFNGKGSVYDL
jgi:hypothetical protein